MQSYLGKMTSTALPRSSNSRLSPYTTSARPPTLAAGASSGAMITIDMAGMDGAGAGGASTTDSSFFTRSAAGSLIPANPRTISSSEIGAADGPGDRSCFEGRIAGSGMSWPVEGWGFNGAPFASTNPALG